MHCKLTYPWPSGSDQITTAVQGLNRARCSISYRKGIVSQRRVTKALMVFDVLYVQRGIVSQRE